MADWVPILTYRDFYDVPHQILLRYKGILFMLDSTFLEDRDEYSDTYEVYRLSDVPNGQVSDPAGLLSLDGLERLNIQIPVSDVVFDPTCRRAIREDCLEGIASLVRDGPADS